MAKETCKRDILSLYDMPEAWMPEACQDIKEMYVCAQKDVYIWQKRPVKETYSHYMTCLRHVKMYKRCTRDACMCAKRRIYMAKETCTR